MERKLIEKPHINLPITVGVVGVFSNNYSSSIFFADAFKKTEGVKSVIRFDYRRILKEHINFIQNIVDLARNVDLMIIMKGSGLPLQAIKLCSTHCRTLFWMMDTYSHFNRSPMMLENSVFCDYRTATGYGTKKLWEEKIGLPVFHVLDGSITSIYYPTDIRKQYDVTFIGGSDRERDSIYNFLKGKFNVKFFGPNYSNGFIKPNEFRQICNKSHIVLNISRGHYEGYSSLRLWNLLACGSMVITKKIPDMKKYMGLENDVHIVEFNNFVELVKKIEYYLKNEDDRNKIAENGLKFLRENRTWENSAKEIIDIISTTKGSSIVPQTPGLVIPRKKNSIPKKRFKCVKKEDIPKDSPNKKSKKTGIGVSRRVKSGWITA